MMIAEDYVTVTRERLQSNKGNRPYVYNSSSSLLPVFIMFIFINTPLTKRVCIQITDFLTIEIMSN